MSKLYIIPGHGAGDCGAVGNGYQEAERVRALAQRIKDFGGDDVVLSDFRLNSYKANIIGKGLVPKGYKILELHMDSSEISSAKGGHVIINGKFKADEYDNALANMISTMFPGRSQTIVGRTDLANVNRSASMGYNYRLMECGFISNAEDVQKFNSRMDEIAKGILGCFGIGLRTKSPTPNPTPTTAPTPTPAPAPSKPDVTYKVWDDVKNKWLPNVKNDSNYAGIFGHDVCALFANLSEGNITYKVHYKDGKWLPEVKNREDYAGLLNKPIDGLMMKTDTDTQIYYRVHLRRSNKGLPWVTGYSESDNNNGYAGIIGQEIDGIQIKF